MFLETDYRKTTTNGSSLQVCALGTDRFPQVLCLGDCTDLSFEHRRWDIVRVHSAGQGRDKTYACELRTRRQGRRSAEEKESTKIGGGGLEDRPGSIRGARGTILACWGTPHTLYSCRKVPTIGVATRLTSYWFAIVTVDHTTLVWVSTMASIASRPLPPWSTHELMPIVERFASPLGARGCAC